MHNDDSPDDTVLPIRVRHLANQLRELLSTFNSGDAATAATSSSGALAPPPAQGGAVAATSASAVAPPMASGGASTNLKRWRTNSTTRRRRWGRKSEAEGGDRGDESKGVAAHTVVRPRCVSSTEPPIPDPDDRGRHTSVETSSLSLTEDTEEAGRDKA